MADIEPLASVQPSSWNKIMLLLKSEETREISSFVMTQFIGFFVFRALVQIFPLYLQRVTTLTQAEVAIKWGIIVSAFTFGSIVTRVPIGLLVEKIGRKMASIISYLLMVLLTLGLMFSTSTWYLALAFVGLRTSVNTFGLCSRSLLSDMDTRFKGFYNALLSSFGRLGSLIGTITLGVIIEFLPSYVMLIFPAAITLVALVIFIAIFYEGKAEKFHAKRKLAKNNGHKVKFQVKDFVNLAFLSFFIIFILFGVAEGITGTVMSLYGKNILLLSESYVGTIIGLAQIGFIASSPFVGILISKNRKYLLILPVVSIIIWIADYIIIYFFPLSLSAYIAFLIIRNLIQAMFWTSALTILTTDLPKEKFALHYSILTTMFFAGLSLGSFFSGKIFAIDYRLTWLTSMIITITLLVMLLLYFVLQRRKSKASSSELLSLGFK